MEFASALAAGGEIEYTRHDARNSRALGVGPRRAQAVRRFLFASGMAAVTAVLEVCAPDAVATPTVVYSGLPRRLQPAACGGASRRTLPPTCGGSISE